MKKAWSVIIIIVLIAILLGAVSIGVGFLTGADSERIISVLDNRYNVRIWYEYITEDIPRYVSEFFNALLNPETVLADAPAAEEPGITVEVTG